MSSSNFGSTARAGGPDIGFGDVLTEPPEIVDGKDFLAFAGVLRACTASHYPRAVHIAEKLHAYTLLVRARTRV